MPAIGRGKLHRITSRHAVGIQLHRHGRRADAILVVSVVPGLRNLDGGFVRAGRLRVRQHVGEVAIRVLGEFNGSRVAFGGANLLDAVLDVRAALLRRQVRPRALPVAFRIIGSLQSQRVPGHGNLFGVANLLVQLHSHIIRARSVLVVGILPRLLHAYTHLGGCVRVGQRVGEAVAVSGQATGNLRSVALDAAHLRHRVGDGLTGGVLHQVRPRGGPPVAGGKRLGAIGNNLAVGVQLHRHGRRTDAVGVVRVVPHLVHSDAGLRNLMRVGQRERIVTVLIRARGDRAGIAGNGNLVDGVGVRAIGTPHGQIFECGRPVIAGRKRLRANDLLRPTVHAAH